MALTPTTHSTSEVHATSVSVENILLKEVVLLMLMVIHMDLPAYTTTTLLSIQTLLLILLSSDSPMTVVSSTEDISRMHPQDGPLL